MFEQEFNKSLQEIEKRFINWINNWLTFLKQKIEEKTPEDTRTLVWNYEKKDASVQWNIVSGKVLNRTPYAYWVEYGVWGRIYKYNKPKGNIFKIWVWARMMTRTKEENQEEIVNIIKQSLWTK